VKAFGTIEDRTATAFTRMGAEVLNLNDRIEQALARHEDRLGAATLRHIEATVDRLQAVDRPALPAQRALDAVTPSAGQARASLGQIQDGVSRALQVAGQQAAQTLGAVTAGLEGLRAAIDDAVARAALAASLPVAPPPALPPARGRRTRAATAVILMG